MEVFSNLKILWFYKECGLYNRWGAGSLPPFHFGAVRFVPRAIVPWVKAGLCFSLVYRGTQNDIHQCNTFLPLSSICSPLRTLRPRAMSEPCGHPPDGWCTWAQCLGHRHAAAQHLLLLLAWPACITGKVPYKCKDYGKSVVVVKLGEWWVTIRALRCLLQEVVRREDDELCFTAAVRALLFGGRMRDGVG